MNLKMILHQSQTAGFTYAVDYIDVSDMVYNVVLENQISGQPSKLTFKCVDDSVVDFPEGSRVTLTIDGVNVFCGRVFTDSYSDEPEIGVTCYDQLRYLQCQDTYVISGMTASQVFEMICKDAGIKNYKVVSPSKLIIPPRVHDEKTFYDIINFGIGYELRTNKKWYMVRDNFGVLEFIDIKELLTDFKFTEYDNIFKFDFSSSIDSDTYNQVKIYQENRVNKKGKPVKNGGKVVSRDCKMAKSDDTINQWGMLQYSEKSDKGMNDAQLQMYANSILSQKNRPTRTFKVNTEGNLGVNAGNQIFIYTERTKQKLPNYTKFLVISATHTFSNNEHKMDLALQMPQYGMKLAQIR